GNTHETYVWKTADGVQVQEFSGGGKSLWALGWSPDGKQIAWGNTNLGQTIKSETSLEFTFNLESFDFGPPPGEKMQRAVLARDGYSLEALDFYKIAIKQGDKIVHTYVSDLQKERIYSMTMLAGKKAAIGGAYGLTLVDLETGKSIHEFDGHSGQVLAVAPSPDGKYFLSGGTDQTIYLWDPAVKTPLMTFFVAGRHWIAWHPSGFYAASPMGERLMGWQLNHGPEKMASFHPALRFHASLYRPEVVRRLPLAGSLDQAIALARKAGHDVADITGVGAVLPPRVRIDSPTAALALDDKGEFEVKASAESEGDHPVLSLRLLVDGRPYAGENGIRPVPKPGPGKVTAAWKVVVPPGKHQVAVQAVSKVSRAVTPPLEITYTQKEPPRPNLYFVGIGITAYPGDLRLQFAAKDAEVLANVLREKSRPLYDKIEIKLLTDASATRANIMKELSWLRGSMTAKDVAIFFFSGHGGRDELNQFQMLPVDVDLDALDKTCVSGAFLKQTLENMPGRVVAILDACHSGEVADLPDSKKRVADSLVRDLVSEDYGVVVMCSSLGSEFSLEDPDAGHGFFTYGLVEGLNGLADYNRDQVVFIHELDFYAALRTTQRSRGLQHPTTSRPPGIRTFALSKP
ncbi:MAG: caspase family protein, partial [Gemmataceae bacterium]